MFYKDELQAFKEDYIARRENADSEIAKLRAEKADYKVRLKNNEITNKEYQEHITNLKEQIWDLGQGVRNYKSEKVDEFVDSGYITKSMIDDYLKK